MGGKGKEAAQRLLAIIVIMTMLLLMGIPPTVIVFFAIVVYFVWRAVQRSEQQETGRIFEFYIAANEILRDEEKHWYGFEIAEVIGRGEAVLHAMKDAPPLVYFALGALYHRARDHESAVEHLSFLVENESGDERNRLAPSPELRRYVHVLRKLEREPAEAPQTMTAIRSLDRARRSRAAALLAESRQQVKAKTTTTVSETALTESASNNSAPKPFLADMSSDENNRNGRQSVLSPVQPPPIAEVLRDLYEEEKRTA